MGIPVVIAENGQGIPVKPVEDNAPVMTVAENGLGAPIVISELGAPFIVEGIAPTIDWDWQMFSMTTGGDGFQWVGYSVGGATLPNPAFGSISNEPTDKATLLAFYQDTASGVVLAVFSGEWEIELAGLEVSLGGLVLEPFEIEIIGGNTWLRYDGMPGLWTEGVVYEVLFGWDLVQAPFAITEAILGTGGLDYALYDSTALDRMWQEQTGQTPAALAAPIGQIIGREKQGNRSLQEVLAEKPELLTNGEFAQNVNGWTLVGGSTLTWQSSNGGEAYFVSDGTSNTRAYQAFATEAGKNYFIEVLGSRENNGLIRVSATNAGPANDLGDFGLLATPQTYRLLFKATGPATYVSFGFGNNLSRTTIQRISVKELPAHYARQATSGQRPSLQADGVKFDGVSQNLLTDWFAQTGENCIIAQVTVPAAIPSPGFVAGATAADTGSRSWLGFNSAGQLMAGAGVTAGLVGVDDLRGDTVLVGFSYDGDAVQMFENANQIIDIPQSGNPATNVAYSVAARNVGGTRGGFFGGSIKRIAFGKVAITLEQFQQIRAEWLAAV